MIYGSGVEDAKGYHKNSGLQWTAAATTLDRINWKGNEKILDVGCGDGKITALMAENLTSNAVIGVDISESMIRFASAKYNQEQHGNLVFLKADATNLPFQHQFDVVVSFSTLHWAIDQNAALKSLQKALIPGGRLLILTYGKAPMNLSKLSENLIYSEQWSSYFSDYQPQRVYFTPEEYVELLQTSGFDQVNVFSQWSQTRYSNRQSLRDFVSPLLNFIGHLPADLKQDFIDQVVDQIIFLSKPTNDGSIVFEVLKLEATAAKYVEK